MKDRTEKRTTLGPLGRCVGIGALSASLAFVSAAGLAVSASASSAVNSASAPKPVEIMLTLDTGLIAYDLLWSDRADEAREALAQQAIAAMDHPATPYVLKIPQAPVAWRPIPADFAAGAASSGGRRAVAASSVAMRDMHGRAMDMAKARLGRVNYERDLEAALLDVVDRIRRQRPGAILSIDQFVQPTVFGARAGAYSNLINSLDFVVLKMPTAASAASTRGLSSRARAVAAPPALDLARAMSMAAPADGLFVLVEHNGSYTAVDDDPLPEIFKLDTDSLEDLDWAPVSQQLASQAPPTTGGPLFNGDNSPPVTPPFNGPPVVVTPDTPANDHRPEPDNNDDPPVDQTPGSDDQPNNTPTTNDNPPADQPPVTPPADDDPPADDTPPTPAPPADDDGEQPEPPAPSDPPSSPPSPPHNPPTPPQSPPADNPAPDDNPDTTGVILTPGAGFNGPTPVPAPIGSGPGADAKAIARWDVVPFQPFDDTFTVGVVAFHVNGIDRVEFSAQGGPWTPVYDMTLNPRTGVWEYVATLDASRFPDGPVEVRAIAYPVKGVPRVLAGPINQNENPRIFAGEKSIIMYANSGGSLTEMTVHVAKGGADNAAGTAAEPFGSLVAALNRLNQAGPDIGRIVINTPGSYEVATTQTWPIPRGVSTWVTIEPAPGVAREDVIVHRTERDIMRPKMNRLRWRNLTIDWANILEYYPEPTHVVWFDSALFIDSHGRTHPYDGANQRYLVRGDNSGGYATNVTARNSFHGIPSMTLVRGAVVESIAGDCFYGSSMVLNSRVTDFDGGINEWHSDVFQFPAGARWENHIYFDITVSAHGTVQPIFFGWTGNTTFKDMAFVNVAVRVDGASVAQTQLGSRTDHLLFWNYSQVGRDFTFRDDRTFEAPNYQRFVATNVSFRNSVISKINRGGFGWTGLPDGVEMHAVHLIDPGFVSAGDVSGMTTGPVLLDILPPDAGGARVAGRTRHTGAAATQLVNSGVAIPGGAPWLRDENAANPDRGASPK